MVRRYGDKQVAPSSDVLSVLRAYGDDAQFLCAKHTGYNGGVTEDGVTWTQDGDLLRQRLHENGYHFVVDKHVYYVKVSDHEVPEEVTASLEQIVKDMDAGRLVYAPHRQTRAWRSRIRVFHPPFTVAELLST